MSARFKGLLPRINNLLMPCLLLALFILLAWCSYRYPIEFDWTQNSRHSLSQASQEMLSQLSDPIKITCYARNNQIKREKIRQFIRRYQRHKNDISLDFIHPDAHPEETRRLGIRTDGELIIQYRDRSEHVRPHDEQALTRVLQRLYHDQERWLVFIEGHGERDPFGQANFDLGEWGKQLRGQGLKIQRLNLAQIGTIPDNTSLLVIADPRANYLPGEVAIITQYIDHGGSLLWLADPGPSSGLAPLLEELGLSLHAGTIIDSAAKLIKIDDPRITLITKSLYPPHTITQGLSLTTLFPHAAGIQIHASPRWQAKPILLSGKHTWIETGALSGEIGLDSHHEIQGPINLGISLERRPAQPGVSPLDQRIIIIGDSDFLSNAYLGNSGNLALGMRLIHWLNADNELLNIPPNIATDIELSLSPMTLGIIGLWSLFGMPLILLIIAISVYYRRKRQ